MLIFLETTNEVTYKKGILSLIGYIGFFEWSERMGRSCTSVFSRHIQKSVRSSRTWHMVQEEIEVGKYLYSTDTSIRKTGQGVTTFTGDAGERHVEPHCRQMISMSMIKGQNCKDYRSLSKY